MNIQKLTIEAKAVKSYQTFSIGVEIDSFSDEEFNKIKKYIIDESIKGVNTMSNDSLIKPVVKVTSQPVIKSQTYAPVPQGGPILTQPPLSDNNDEYCQEDTPINQNYQGNNNFKPASQKQMEYANRLGGYIPQGSSSKQGADIIAAIKNHKKE